MKHISSRETLRNPDNTSTWLLDCLPPHPCKKDVTKVPTPLPYGQSWVMCPFARQGMKSPTLLPEGVNGDPTPRGIKKHRAL